MYVSLLQFNSMIHFLDLDSDVLLLIIEHAQSYSSNRGILNLSVSCRLLNSLCGRWIFKRYTFVIRSRDDEPLNEFHDLLPYQKTEVEERLRHLRSKIHLIQELTIRDHFYDSTMEHRGPSFMPRAIVRPLMKILKLGKKLNSLAIDSGTNKQSVLPKVVWTWILQRDHWEVLVFTGNIKPPLQSRPYTGTVQELSVGLLKYGSACFLDVSLSLCNLMMIR